MMSLFVVYLLSVSDGEDTASQFNYDNNICDVLRIYRPSVTERTQHKQMNLYNIYVCCMRICSPSVTEQTQHHSQIRIIFLLHHVIVCCVSTVRQ